MISTPQKAPVLCVMLLLAVGCARQANVDSTAPADVGAAGDELAMLEQQLTVREGQLNAVGVTGTSRLEKKTTADAASNEAAPTSVGNSPSPSALPEPTQRTPEANADRCTRVCEITTAICALEDQICGLLPRHPGEARYQAACDRSSADCQLATEACHACTGN